MNLTPAVPLATKWRGGSAHGPRFITTARLSFRLLASRSRKMAKMAKSKGNDTKRKETKVSRLKLCTCPELGMPPLSHVLLTLERNYGTMYMNIRASSDDWLMAKADNLIAINPEALTEVQVAMPSDALLEVVVETFQALADPTRSRILYALIQRPLCVR